MKTNRQIDFFVIGAQKAGTTSLHYQLAKHPGIALPASKEAPFFSRDEVYSRGLDWYIREFFSKANSRQLLGTVTPQYMAYPQVAERMRQHCPGARLIAILRDPIDRARSHFRMRVRAFGEQRSFQQAILEQLDDVALVESRKRPTPSNSYIIWGEYGRILSDFLAYFQRDQLLVVFLDDFDREPAKVLTSIYSFLSLEPVDVHDHSRRYNVAQSATRLSISGLLGSAVQNGIIRSIGKNLIPVRLKHRLAFWSIINRNSSKTSQEPDMNLSEESLARLGSHYVTDLRLLEALGAGPIPWRERIAPDGN